MAIGAGRRDRPGYVAERAEARGAVPIGIDIAEGMVAVARRNHPELEFMVADAEELPFQDGSFDAVVGNFVINHLPAAGASGFAEAARVLVGDGRLAFSAWLRPDRMLIMGLIGDALEVAHPLSRTSRPPVSRPGRTATGSPTRPSSGGCSRRPGWLRSPSSRWRSCRGSRTPRPSTARLHGWKRAGRGVRTGSVRRRSGADPDALDAVVEPYQAGNALEVPVAAQHRLGPQGVSVAAVAAALRAGFAAAPTWR